MNLNSIEDFEENFPDEETALKYLTNIRWPDKITCPKCGSEKIWATRSKKAPYCCGNKECYANFSVRSCSLIKASNISIRDWLLYIFYFTKSRGRMSSSQMDDLNFATVFLTDEKLRCLFEGINKYGKDNYSIFEEAVKNIFILKDKILEINSTKLIKEKFLRLDKVYDLNVKSDYHTLLFFIRKTLYFQLYKKWIFSLFCEPEDVMAEMYITISEGEATEMTGYFLKEMIFKTIGKMWRAYVKNNPTLENYIRNYQKEWKRQNIKKMGKWYLSLLISGRNPEWGNSFKDVSNNKELLKNKKNELIEFRKRNVRMSLDDEFHVLRT